MRKIFVSCLVAICALVSVPIASATCITDCGSARAACRQACNEGPWTEGSGTWECLQSCDDEWTACAQACGGGAKVAFDPLGWSPLIEFLR